MRQKNIKKKKNKFLNIKTITIGFSVLVIIILLIILLNQQIVINNKTIKKDSKNLFSKSISVSYDISYKKCDSSETYIFATSLNSNQKLYEEIDEDKLSDEDKKYKNDFFFPIINLLTKAKKEGYFFDVNKISYDSKNKEGYIVISSNKFEKNKILGLYYDILDDFEKVNKLKDIESDGIEKNLSINKYKYFKYIETEYKSKAFSNEKINNIFSFLYLNNENVEKLTIKNNVFKINFNLYEESKILLESKVSNIKSIAYLTDAKVSNK